MRVGLALGKLGQGLVAVPQVTRGCIDGGHHGLEQVQPIGLGQCGGVGHRVGGACQQIAHLNGGLQCRGQ